MNATCQRTVNCMSGWCGEYRLSQLTPLSWSAFSWSRMWRDQGKNVTKRETNVGKNIKRRKKGEIRSISGLVPILCLFTVITDVQINGCEVQDREKAVALLSSEDARSITLLVTRPEIQVKHSHTHTHLHHPAALSWQLMSCQIKRNCLLEALYCSSPFERLYRAPECTHMHAQIRETGLWQDLLITAAGGGWGCMAGRWATGACWGAEDGYTTREEEAEGTKLSEARWGEGGCQVKQNQNKRQRCATMITEEE